MSLYVRQLSIDDLERSFLVETAAFPPAEAATREKIEYRLTVCPELCMGLFLHQGTSLPSTIPQDIPFVTEPESNDDVLLAHVISTKSTNKSVRNEDMEYPPSWKSNPQGEYDIGHKKNGRTIALHALAVSPDYQRSGLGKAIMRAYIEQMTKMDAADRISILTYDRLVPYYQKLAFEHWGKSECEYAGVEWHDLSYPLPPAPSPLSEQVQAFDEEERVAREQLRAEFQRQQEELEELHRHQLQQLEELHQAQLQQLDEEHRLETLLAILESYL